MNSKQGRMTHAVLVPAVAAALLALGACTGVTEADSDYVAVCTDRAGNRVDDTQCAHAPASYTHDSFGSGDMFLWYYLGTQMGQVTAPAVGQRVTGGYYRTPVTVPSSGGGAGAASGATPKAPTIARGGSVPSAGGTVSRGGLGIKGGSSGSGSSSGGAKGSSGGSSGS